MTDGSETEDDGLPRYLKVIILVAVIVVLFVLVVDLLAFASAF